MASLIQSFCMVEGDEVTIQALVSSPIPRQIVLYYTDFDPTKVQISEQRIGAKRNFRAIPLPLNSQEELELSEEACELILELQESLSATKERKKHLVA